MKNKGFTLIEIMIVVAIIGVLAGIAIPSISHHLMESRRTDAIVALNGLQQAQAKLRANCRFYAGALGAGGCDTTVPITAADTQVNVSATSENDLYNIALVAADASGNGYTATATATGSQVNDAECLVFTLTVNAANPNGLKTPAACW